MPRKICGVAHQPPFDPLSWSGITAYLFHAFGRTGRLRAAVAAELPPWADRLRKLVNVHPDLRTWKTNYAGDTRFRPVQEWAGRRALRNAGLQPDDVVLQIGAWYDFSGLGAATMSYHDGNFAARYHSPYGGQVISAPFAARKLAMEREIYDHMDRIFTMSQWLAGTFEQYYDVPADKLTPVYAGINIPEAEQLPPRGSPGQRIVFVGIEFERKGGPQLLQAFRQVRAALPDAELTIIGPTSGPSEPGVHWAGFLSKRDAQGVRALLEAYDQADLFVLPTRYEPFGVVFCEAMSRGLPCIGSNICAIPEIIEDGKTGYLVEPEDVDALAERMIELLSEPDLARRMGEAGFRRFRDRFRWDAVVERMLVACDRTVAPPSSRATP